MRVLVADGDIHHRKGLVETLEGLGHQVNAVRDGDEAWEILRQRDIRLVVADWVIPGMSGLDLIRKIRSGEIRHHVYVILLTLPSDYQDVVRGLDVGADDYVKKPFDEEELILRLRAGQRVLRLQEELATKNDRLRNLALVDSLTGVRNRRAFDEEYGRVHAEATRYDHPYSLAIIDIDRFKPYNDAFGHQEGDLALKSVARLLVKNARSSDVVFRYGGEEFAWILTHTDAERSRVGAERMRRLVEEARVPHPANPPHDLVTVSIGVSSFDPERWIAADEVFRRADEALYRAKQGGRNRIEILDPVIHTRSAL